MQTKNKPLHFVLTIALICFYIGILLVNQRRNEIVDDAFITYRYARNFAEDGQLVYNQGEMVLGTTSPAYALLLGIGGFLTSPDSIPTISLWFNFICTLLIMLCLSLAVYKLSEQSYWLALIAPFFVIASSMTLDVIVFGMEGSLYLILIFLSLTLIIYRKWSLGYIVAGFTIWVRPEGIFLIALIGIMLLANALMKRSKWSSFFAYSAGLVIPSLLYFLMLLTVYNSILPQSIIAKVSGLYPVPPFEQLNIIIQYLSTPVTTLVYIVMGDNFSTISSINTYLTLLGISLFLMTVGSIKLIKIDYTLWLIPSLLLIHTSFYASRGTKLFEWYHSNYHLFIVILCAVGLGQILYSILKLINIPNRLHIIGVALISLMAVPTIIITPYSHYLQLPRQPHYVSGRVTHYYDLLQELGHRIPETAVVALPEIGYLGFYLPDNDILDTAGLVSPEIVSYFPVAPEDQDHPYLGVIPKDAIFDLQPDIIITFDIFANSGLYRTAWFDDMYEQVYTISNLEVFSSTTNLSLFVHTDKLDSIEINLP